MADAKMQQQMQAAQQQSAKIQEMKMKKEAMLKQILSPEANERLTRIGLVKPQMAEKVADMMLRLAGNGQIKSKVTEDQFKGYLEQINKEAKPKTKITFARRRFADEDDDSEDYDDM
uniref:Programmed cell death protein 5 n=1 Tax=Lotharella oceanica TaxID=641309 RepID=A0A7S2TXW6_9EUKA|mmetsp:Transcript_34788/g.64394  ORF Transcript_34788/g.64394 Transcript_34788/m.64394 type:complete len:117 (+) Transcript_34788:41-391(+)